MRMRKFFSLMATVLMAVGVQAQTAEKLIALISLDKM